jgi:hypothetical protein
MHIEFIYGAFRITQIYQDYSHVYKDYTHVFMHMRIVLINLQQKKRVDGGCQWTATATPDPFQSGSYDSTHARARSLFLSRFRSLRLSRSLALLFNHLNTVRQPAVPAGSLYLRVLCGMYARYGRAPDGRH